VEARAGDGSEAVLSFKSTGSLPLVLIKLLRISLVHAIWPSSQERLDSGRFESGLRIRDIGTVFKVWEFEVFLALQSDGSVGGFCQDTS